MHNGTSTGQGPILGEGPRLRALSRLSLQGRLVLLEWALLSRLMLNNTTLKTAVAVALLLLPRICCWVGLL